MNTAPQSSTKAEREAVIAKLFVGLKPAEERPQSALEKLRPYRAQLLAKRREGFSLRQIADAVKAAPFGVTVSPALVRDLLRGQAAVRRTKQRHAAAKRAERAAKEKTSSAVPATAPAVGRV